MNGIALPQPPRSDQHQPTRPHHASDIEPPRDGQVRRSEIAKQADRFISKLNLANLLTQATPVVILAMAVTFVFACLVVLFNLIADILYGWLDPRITFR